ncbi:MAG: hypothetical protein ACE15B_07455 [Bryobacteraceae bacterium]
MLLAAALAAAASSRTAELPYRFLLVISDQWKDPASYVVEGAGEFPMVVSLLKAWNLPFEILRLDQQRLDRYHLLERDGRPRYGAVIWDAGPDHLKDKGIDLIASLVKEHGVGLVALGDAVAVPEIATLAGVEYVSGYRLPAALTFTGGHFITRGLESRAPEFMGGSSYQPGDKVAAHRDAAVVAARGALPFLTARVFPNGGRVAWLGAHRDSVQLRKQIVRDLFKRCLVWAQGYALYPEFPRAMLLEMHDMGASDKTFLAYWHYRNLNEDEIRRGIIEPLKRHRAVLACLVNTGYVDRKSRRVLNPWRQERVTDELDSRIVHDYASLKRGLDAGQREGVFEIQCHGWTHMLPDLDSPPGPLWDAPLDGAATLGWDNEFGDRIRKQEIPAAVQRVHIQRALENLREDFGVTPLFLRPGGGEYSPAYERHTGRIAAQMGFGLTRLASPYYLGHDFVIALGALSARTWAFDRKITAADVPWTVDGPYFLAFHDRDVAMDATAVERLLTALGAGVRYLSPDEYAAYLHAAVERDASAGPGLTLAVHYDGHYCRYFGSHPSSWVLHLSDETRASLGPQAAEKQSITFGPGLGRRVVRAGSPQTK